MQPGQRRSAAVRPGFLSPSVNTGEKLCWAFQMSAYEWLNPWDEHPAAGGSMRCPRPLLHRICGRPLSVSRPAGERLVGGTMRATPRPQKSSLRELRFFVVKPLFLIDKPKPSVYITHR